MWALAADSGRTEWTAEFDGPVVAAAGSPDGSRVAAALLLGDAAAAVVVLDRRTGAELGRVVEGTDVPASSTGLPAAAVTGLSPQVAWLDDERLAVLGSDGVTVLSGSTLHVIDEVRWRDRPVPFWSVIRAVGPDHVAVTGAVQPGVVVDLGTGAARRIEGEGDVLAVSPDGAVAAVTSWPDTSHPDQRPGLTMVETDTWTAIAPHTPLPAFHGAAAFSADGSVLALGVGETVQLRDPRTGALQRELAGHNGVVMGVAFTGDADDPLWSAGRDGAAFQWDPSGRRGVIRSPGVDAAAARIVAASRDGRTGVVLDWHDDAFNEARLVDPATGLPLGPDPLPMPEDCACQPFPVAITPDGRTALAGLDVLSDPDDWSAPHTGRLLLWDVASRQIRADLELPWAPVGLGVVGDGTRVLVNGTDGWAVVDITRSRVLTTVADGPTVAQLEVPDSVAVSPDGRHAAAGRAHHVVLVDGRTGDELHRHRLPDGDGMLTGDVGGRAHARRRGLGRSAACSRRPGPQAAGAAAAGGGRLADRPGGEPGGRQRGRDRHGGQGVALRPRVLATTGSGRHPGRGLVRPQLLSGRAHAAGVVARGRKVDDDHAFGGVAPPGLPGGRSRAHPGRVAGRAPRSALADDVWSRRTIGRRRRTRAG